MIRFLLVLCLLFFPLSADALSVCKTTLPSGYTPVEKRYESGLLFRITSSCDIIPSYIFGTVHSDRKDIYGSAEDAVIQVTKARMAAFEYLDDANSSAIVDKHMFYPDGSNETFLNAVGQDIYDQFFKANQRLNLVPSHAEEKMRPWAVALMMQIPAPTSDGIILDDRLKKLATDSGVNLLGLETLESQLSIFSRMSPSRQLTMLRDTLENLDYILDSNETINTLYINRNLNGLLALSEEMFSRTADPALEAYLRRALLTSRNKSMTRAALPEIEKGNLFIAVGALHLPGPEGMLTLLEKEGYQIEAVNP